MEVHSSTVLKDSNGKKFKGKLATLDYLFRFLDAYDFATDGTEVIVDAQETKTLINASVLGLIFEKINGYKDGSFYTPAYITMYMCKETIRRSVAQKFKKQENDTIDNFDDVKAYCHRFFKAGDTKRFNEIINSLRICDPAVGSGHFLVSALNELICIKNELGILVDEKGIPLRVDIQLENDELYLSDANGALFEYNPNDSESNRVQKALFEEKKTLIENCLFGVDINPNSVKICRLRLWIELLKNAYYTAEKQLHTLPNIDINIKCGNSLISRFDLNDDLKDAFKGKDVKYNFSDYKKAVAEYKNTNSKERKQQVLDIIDEVKNNFKSTLDNKFIDKVSKALGEYENEKQRLENLALFGEKIKKVEKDKLKVLKEKAEKTKAEKESIVNNLIFKNAFEWRFEFPEVLDEKGIYVGFDVVIGNPPYVDIKELNKSDVEYFFSRYKTTSNRINLYSIFVENVYSLLRDKASFSFIIPNSILMNSSYLPLRKLIVNDIIEIVKLPDNIFDEAIVETIIFNLIKNDGNAECSVIRYGAKKKINFIQKDKRQEINKRIWKSFDDLKFNIYIDENVFKVLNKLNSFEKVDSYADFTLGITPYDKYKGHSKELIKNREYHSKYMLSEEYKPLIKGENIMPYIITKNISEYIRYGNWLGAPREERFFTEPRIIIRQIISGNPPKIYAGYTEDPLYFTQIGFSVITKNMILPKYLLSILNSKLVNFYHKYMFLDIEKELFQKILIENCRKLPIAKINSYEQQNYIDIIDQILTIKKENQDADTSVLEKEIDNMVYELYGLTEGEIAIVENS